MKFLEIKTIHKMIITPLAKYLHKANRMGTGIFFGIMFFSNVYQEDLDVLDCILYLGLFGVLLVVCIFNDHNEFLETKKIKSYTSTAVLMSVILFDLGFYFYWV